jgi:ATP diphosphatase
MISRHPHVFGGEAARGATAHSAAWETQKAAERLARGETGVLAGIAPTLPALAKAQKLCARAARVGFDWPDAPAVLEKLEEEILELRAELPGQNPERLKDELGDLFFVLANLARKLGQNAEACLAGANEKFTRRFSYIEAALAADGKTPAQSSLEEMEELWTEAKRAEAKK